MIFIQVKTNIRQTCFLHLTKYFLHNYPNKTNILNKKETFAKPLGMFAVGILVTKEKKKKKKNRHLPQMKLKYQMKLMIFRLYMNFDELIFNHCAITNTKRIKTVNKRKCGNSPI